MKQDAKVVVLGAGPAGLACGWALEESGDGDYAIFEKGSVYGGNARTVRFQEFLYDTGPHRFHARDPETTEKVSKLLGADLKSVEAPSRIWWKGKFVDFPLRPIQILRDGGLLYTLRASRDFISSRFNFRNRGGVTSFSDFAVRRFGATIANTFLIPFSERLWGLPGSDLSPDIAGRRLPGFSIMGMVKDFILPSRQSDHLEGRFLYPRLGYGQISDAMAGNLTSDRLKYGHRVVGIETEHDRVVTVQVEADSEVIRVEPTSVINTLPITSIVQMMTPIPPDYVLEAASKLQFRDLVLVVLFVDVESISSAAVTYFQGNEYEFSRAHEPRNRSIAMSPAGKTSLVVEFPCFKSDSIWSRNSDELAKQLICDLDTMGLIDKTKVLGHDIHRLENAYPVYFQGYKEISEIVISYLDTFRNLRSLGRGGSYFYGHVHDFVREGFEVVESIRSSDDSPSSIVAGNLSSD